MGSLQDPDDPGPHDGRLRGPSAGLQNWGAWIVALHKGWHEGDPSPSRFRWRMVGVGGWLLALVAILEKAVGG
jgi:hypothetical protein